MLRRFYSWHDQTIAVEFAGEALMAALTRAVAHRETEPVDEPAFTISAWAGFEPPAIHDAADVVRSGETITVIDRDAGRVDFWTPSVDAVPVWMRGGPWRTVLHWWWRAQGRQIVHAAAVGRNDAGVLLAGGSGTGKSTTAFACLRAGMDWLGDDYCVVSVDDEARATGLYAAGKLTDEALALFPALAQLVAPLTGSIRSDSGKRLYFLDPAFRSQLKETIAIKAILLPQVTNVPTSEIVPASRADGLRAMAPSTLLQSPGAGDFDMRQMTRIARTLPSYRLRLGSDLDGITGAIDEFLSALR